METIKQEARLWVSRMNEYPLEMIQILMETIPDEWQEVTLPKLYDKVHSSVFPEEFENDGEIVKIEGSKYVVKLKDGNMVTVDAEEIEVERDTILPMWGCMWSFKNKADEYWMKDKDGIKAMSECGFRIYEHEEWGYFFGIDGAGYDFYEKHWIPAFLARGIELPCSH